MSKIQKHIVICPSCGQEVLDHMSVCPHCQGELTPSGYGGADTERNKRLKKTLNIIFWAAAAVVLLYIFMNR